MSVIELRQKKKKEASAPKQEGPQAPGELQPFPKPTSAPLPQTKAPLTKEKSSKKKEIEAAPPRSIGPLDLQAFLTSKDERHNILLTDTFKVVKVISPAGAESYHYFLSKKRLSKDFPAFLSLVDTINHNFPGVFIADFLVSQDESFYHLSLPKRPRLMATVDSIAPQKVERLLATLEQASVADENCILSLIVNPLNFVDDKDGSLLIDPFLGFFNWFNKPLSFAEALFFPPEYLFSENISKKSFRYVTAAVRLFFYHSVLPLDYKNIEATGPQTLQTKIDQAVPSPETKTYFAQSLQNLPGSRQHSDFHTSWLPKTDLKPSFLLLSYLHLFACFVAEVAHIFERLANFEAEYLKAFGQLDDSIHYLTAEELFRATVQNDPTEKFEHTDRDVSMVLRKADNQRRETLRPGELAEGWLSEKLLKVQKKYRDQFAGRVLFRQEINHESYLGQMKSVKVEQKTKILSLFREIF